MRLGLAHSNDRLGSTLNEGIAKLLDLNKSPSRKVNEIDNRGTNFYVALYWAEALAAQDSSYAELAANLAANEESIVQELVDCEPLYSTMRPRTRRGNSAPLEHLT